MRYILWPNFGHFDSLESILMQKRNPMVGSIIRTFVTDWQTELIEIEPSGRQDRSNNNTLFKGVVGSKIFRGYD